MPSTLSWPSRSPSPPSLSSRVNTALLGISLSRILRLECNFPRGLSGPPILAFSFFLLLSATPVAAKSCALLRSHWSLVLAQASNHDGASRMTAAMIRDSPYQGALHATPPPVPTFSGRRVWKSPQILSFVLREASTVRGIWYESLDQSLLRQNYMHAMRASLEAVCSSPMEYQA